MCTYKLNSSGDRYGGQDTFTAGTSLLPHLVIVFFSELGRLSLVSLD